MTAVVLVESLRARGVHLRAEGDKIRFRPASALTSEDLAALRSLKAEVMSLLVVQPTNERITAYRAALWEFWRINAAGAAVPRTTAMATYNMVIKLMDEVGEPTASTLRHRWEREWHQETGRCPRCGERGEHS